MHDSILNEASKMADFMVCSACMNYRLDGFVVKVDCLESG